MASKIINKFIEQNSSNIDKSMKKYGPNDNEFLTVFKIVQNAEIRKQISTLIENLKTIASSSTSKSVADSNKYREEGNRLFRADKKANALAASRWYTHAILAAPKDSPSLALAHANRAAALAEFGYYSDAYCDCVLALNLGYPKAKQTKILLRQAYCSAKLKNYFQLEDVLEKLNNIQLNEQCIKQREDFEEQLKEIAELPSSWKQDEPHDYKVQNILEHPVKGRYMITWKDYQKDDVILTEKAFSFVPVNNAKICSHCANEQFIPYPCYTCSKVVYCSQKCKLADEKIHQYECFAHRCDLYESLGVTYLAMRTLILGFPNILPELSNMTSAEDLFNDIGSKKGYGKILSLDTSLHLQSPKNIRILALGSIIAANYLVSCTKFSELYSKISQVDSFHWSIVIAAFILRHVIQMTTNAQASVAVTHMDSSYDFIALDDIWKEPKHLKKRHLNGFRNIVVNFAGIYPYLSMCNHSCEPSLRLNFDGNRLIGKARQDLKKGDEVFNTYVLDCRNLSVSKRKHELKSAYHFECDCKHCAPENNDEQFLKFHKYLCRSPNCNQLFAPPTDDLRWWLRVAENDEMTFVKCPFCKTPIEVDWFIKFNELFKVEILNRTELKEAFKLFKYTEEILYVSELRQFMAYKIVNSFFEKWKEEEFDENMFKEIALIIKQWLDHVEEQNDVESVLYATTATFALDLMAEGKYFDFDTNKIRRSFDMLTTELKLIFENYVKDYIGEKFDDYET